MTSRDALARLQALEVDVVTTADAASVLGASVTTAHRTLARLADAGLVRRAAHGLWWLRRSTVDALKLVAPAVVPFPAYVSLQSALFRHGLIEQVPSVTYAVTLGRTHRVMTRAGVLSFHHLTPELFGGADEISPGVWLASAEKALVDLAWLSTGRSRLFARLPELELPASFRRRSVKQWSARLKSPQARTRLERAWRRILGAATTP